MTTEPRHSRRMASSLERSARLEEELQARHGRPAAPGDLFVLRATADLPVEWALLERRSDGKLLAVPADAGPPAGSNDVEIPADAPGGPLSLRCRFSLGLDAALFERELRSGVIAEESVTEALYRVHELERPPVLESRDVDADIDTVIFASREELEPYPSGVSPLAEEVDADPEYQDWIRDVIDPAWVLASEAKPAARTRSSGGFSWGVAHQLAAVLAVLAIGLSVWVAVLRREVDRLSQPVFDVPSEDVVVGGTTRGERTIVVPEDAREILLVLVVDSLIEEPEGRFEIRNLQDKRVWGNDSPVPLTLGSEFRLILPRHMLPDGLYRIRLLPASGGDPLGEEILKVETRDN